MSIFFLEDQGIAIYKDGKPYRRINPDGMVMEQPPTFSSIGANDVTNITAFTWDKDDDNTDGTNHKTWSACEMAATYLYGTGGTKTTKDETSYTLPGNVFFHEMQVQLGEFLRAGVDFYGNYSPSYAECEVDPVSGFWVAPKSGVVRMTITDNILHNPIAPYTYTDFYYNEAVCYPSLTSPVGVGVKNGGSLRYVGTVPIHYADATVRSDWLAVRVSGGDKIFFGPMEMTCGLNCKLGVAARENWPTLSDSGSGLYGGGIGNDVITNASAKMQAAMIFLPDTF